MRHFRPFGLRCPNPTKIDKEKQVIETCGGILKHEDFPGWTYIECPKCGTRWVKDHPKGSTR